MEMRILNGDYVPQVAQASYTDGMGRQDFGLHWLIPLPQENITPSILQRTRSLGKKHGASSLIHSHYDRHTP